MQCMFVFNRMLMKASSTGVVRCHFQAFVFIVALIAGCCIYCWADDVTGGISEHPPTTSSSSNPRNNIPSWQSIISDVSDVSPVIPLFGGSDSSDISDDANDSSRNGQDDTKWFLRSADGAYTNIPAKSVPGDIISDLMHNGYMDDPYYNRNFLTQRFIWTGSDNTNSSHQEEKQQQQQVIVRTRTWIYETNLTWNATNDPNRNSYKYLLVMEGIKMGANIAINGITIGAVTNQFVRTVLPIPTEVLTQNKDNNNTSHVLVSIIFDPCIETNGRYMACSGGWDWAPYTRVVDSARTKRQVFTFGITKPLYIVPVRQFYIDSNVMIKTYPTSAINKTTTTTKASADDYFSDYRQDFLVQVQVRVHGIKTTTDGNNNNRHDDINSSQQYYTLRIQANFSEELVEIPFTYYNDEFILSTPSSPSSSSSSPSSLIITVNITATQVQLWWPAGIGAQPLYIVRLVLQTPHCCKYNNDAYDDCTKDKQQTNLVCSSIQKHIGFRDVALITTASNNTNTSSTTYSNTSTATAAASTTSNLPNNENSNNGSGDNGMYFRINGLVNILSRGANLIPMDQLEGRKKCGSSFGVATGNDNNYDDPIVSAYLWSVESAVKANMNTIRVWGGGIIPPPEFYDACDEKGILVYQDLMFVEEAGHGAYQNDSIRTEIEYIIRQLSNHPSIVLWSGCNECSGGGDDDVYASFVLQTVAELDDTRIIWPSSPSQHGWESGVHTSNGKPNGQPLRIRRGRLGHVLESHGPYQRGYSDAYPGVNGHRASNSNETLIPPEFHQQGDIGQEYRNTFVSEFGATAHSSFESMSLVLTPSKWSLHGGESPDTCQFAYGNIQYCNGTNTMAERNYPCDSRIAVYFSERDVSLDEVGPRAFQRQLYLCMIAQALWMKGTVEIFRSSNSFGILIWQLNENWPTGGWGCIEYYNGIQQFGRWKPVMYLLKSLLFQDVLVACGEDSVCYARNDSPVPCTVEVFLEAWDLSLTLPLQEMKLTVLLSEGPSIHWFSVPSGFLNEAHVVLISTNATTTTKTKALSSAYFWKLPKDLPLHHPIVFQVKVRFGHPIVTFELKSSALAIYVVVSTSAPGHFSDNAFVLRPDEIINLEFEPQRGYEFDQEAFTRTLRIEHLGQNSSLKISIEAEQRSGAFATN